MAISLQKRVDDSPGAREDLHNVAGRILAVYLREKGLKQSARRDLVLAVFLDTHDHLSTEELHHLVKARDPSIGSTTVYRTLKLLNDCGLAFFRVRWRNLRSPQSGFRFRETAVNYKITNYRFFVFLRS